MAAKGLATCPQPCRRYRQDFPPRPARARTRSRARRGRLRISPRRPISPSISGSPPGPRQTMTICDSWRRGRVPRGRGAGSSAATSAPFVFPGRPSPPPRSVEQKGQRRKQGEAGDRANPAASAPRRGPARSPAASPGARPKKRQRRDQHNGEAKKKAEPQIGIKAQAQPRRRCATPSQPVRASAAPWQVSETIRKSPKQSRCKAGRRRFAATLAIRRVFENPVNRSRLAARREALAAVAVQTALRGALAARMRATGTPLTNMRPRARRVPRSGARK